MRQNCSKVRHINVTDDNDFRKTGHTYSMRLIIMTYEISDHNDINDHVRSVHRVHARNDREKVLR